MREDQRRTDGGQFGTTDSRHRLLDDDRLENVVSCKITSREVRAISILFDQHRKMFTWQTQSDMLRDLLRDGISMRMKKITMPDPELVQLMLETEQMELAQKMTRRHTHHEKAVEFVAEQIEILNRNKDYGQIRKLLMDFAERTRLTKDPVIRQRRKNEMEQRGWTEQLKELCKGASYDPDNFVDED